MDWNDLRLMLAIAREGSLGKAASRLGLSQPTMGRRLRSLEATLGHTLFQRTPAGFVLTDDGSAVVAHAERIEEETLAIERQLAGGHAQLAGMLRITSSDWFGRLILAPLLAEFGELHPGVCIELLTDARLYSLARREADLAFRITPSRDLDIVSRRLLAIPYALYAPAGTVRPHAGDGEGCRLVTMDTGFSEMPDAQWLGRMLPQATIAMRSNDRDVQAELCRRGAGLAVLPIPLGEATPGLVRLDLGETPPSRETFVGYHRDLRRMPRLRAMLDLAIERLT